MANQVEVLLMAKDAGMFLAFEKAGRSAKEMATAIDRAGKIVEQAGKQTENASHGFEKIDRAGRNARIGLSGFSQIAGMVGINVNSIVGPAAAAADAIGDMAGSLEGLGKAQFAALGAVGLLVGGFLALNDAMMARNQSIETGLRENDAWVKSMAAFAKGNESATKTLDDLVRAMAQVQTGWSWDLGDVIDRWMKFDQVGRGVQQALNLLGIELGSLHPALETSADKVARLTDEMNTAAAAALDLEYAIHAAQQPIRILGDTRGEAIKGMREGKRVISEMNTEAWHLKYEFKEGVGWIERIPKAAAGASAAIRKMEAAAESIRNKFKGIIESALSPTAADPLMGDAWDEARKRFEAFASGTDTGAYGDKFKQMFESLGMSAETAAKKFKDFSLFTDPKNFALVDWDALTANVEAQLQGIAGKAALVSEAIRRVWAGLSDTAKGALAEQGIGDVESAMKQLLDPAGAAQDKVKDLNAEIANIPPAKLTTFDAVAEGAKAVIQDLADFLDRFVNAYGTIHVNADGDFSSPPPPPNGDNGGSGANGARATGGYVGRGLYRLGENGKEYVLPHNMVRYIESILGGPIHDPDEIGWLIGALGRGKEEARNQLGLWAGGRTGWGQEMPGGADKWIDKMLNRYSSDYGFSALSDVNQRALGGSGGGGGGGGGTVVIDLSRVESLLAQIVRNTGGNGGNQLAIGAMLRGAQGLT